MEAILGTVLPQINALGLLVDNGILGRMQKDKPRLPMRDTGVKGLAPKADGLTLSF